MDEELDALRISVRADGVEFSRDVYQMRETLEGTLGAGAIIAGRGIEGALAGAARKGRFEFEDLAKVAAKALGDIAAAALKVELGSGAQGGGIGAAFASVLPGILGLPGRATGGPVGPGQAYLVGERGPELFVPTSSGRVVAGGSRSTGSVNVTVNVSAPRDAGPEFMARTGRQVAQSVRRALDRAGS